MAERKSELEQNLLADWIARVVRDYGPQLRIGGLVVLAVVLGYAIYYLLAANQRRQESQAWHHYLAARAPEDLEQLIREYRGTRVELWAVLDLADEYYGQGLLQLGRDQEAADTRLKQALDLYRRAAALADQFADVGRHVKPRALFGAAQCHEALGEREQALELYEQIAEQFADTWVGKRAAEKAKLLGTGAAGDFYAEFRKIRITTPTPGAESLLPPVPSDSQQPQEESKAESEKSEPEGEATEQQEQPATPEEGASEKEKTEGEAAQPAAEQPAQDKADQPN